MDWEFRRMSGRSMSVVAAASAAAGNARGSAAKKAVVSLGGVLGALAASSCCIVPLALFSLGVGGAWIGNLTALAPYQPIAVAVTVVFLGSGFYLVYGRGKARGCETEGGCTTPKSDRLVKAVLWLSTLLVGAAVAFNFVPPAVMGV